jgi:hypothetical protein
MSVYTYNGDTSCLHIIGDLLLKSGFSNFTNTSSEDNVIKLHFSTEISQNDIQNIETLITNFDQDSYNKQGSYKYQHLNTIIYFVQNTVWVVVSEFMFRGRYIDTIDKLIVNSSMTTTSSADTDTYSVRVCDVATNTIVGSQTFSNKSIVANEIQLDQELMPPTLSVLEIQVKGSSSTCSVKIHSCFLVLYAF